jgi:uncharacterized protein YbjQ (UPF0145 family)
MAGGEVKYYSAVLAQGREQAVQRTIKEGEKTGANARLGEVGNVDGDVWSALWQLMEW